MNPFHLLKKNFVPNTISLVFHPLLMPTFGVWVLLNAGTTLSLLGSSTKLYILALVFMLTFIIPAVILPVFIYFRLMGNIIASERNERMFPIAVTALIYYFSYTFFHHERVLLIISMFILGITIVLILILALNFVTKVSLHMAGIGGMCALALILSLRVSAHNAFFFILSIIIAGIIASARLKLNEHKMLQIALGFFLGFLPIAIMFLFI